MEWNRMELNDIERNGMKWNRMEVNEKVWKMEWNGK